MDTQSSLKRELEGGSGSPSLSRKRPNLGTPMKSSLSTPTRQMKLDPEEEPLATANPEVEDEVLDDVDAYVGEEEEQEDEDAEFIADEDAEEDEELEDESVVRLAEVLGVTVDGDGPNLDGPGGSERQNVPSTSSGATAAEQQDETNRAEDRKLLALMAHFNEDQLSRFEAYRRATFTKSAVNRLIQSVAQTSFSQNVVIAMSGITKVFVGELVEAALDYKEELQETGPLQPKHIRVAYTRLRLQDRTSRPNRHIQRL
ncbi:hypothetical protein Aperf_G00000069838 [Anoplocephala perfoliata]